MTLLTVDVCVLSSLHVHVLVKHAMYTVVNMQEEVGKSFIVIKG